MHSSFINEVFCPNNDNVYEISTVLHEMKGTEVQNLSMPGRVIANMQLPLVQSCTDHGATAHNH